MCEGAHWNLHAERQTGVYSTCWEGSRLVSEALLVLGSMLVSPGLLVHAGECVMFLTIHALASVPVAAAASVLVLLPATPLKERERERKGERERRERDVYPVLGCSLCAPFCS